MPKDREGFITRAREMLVNACQEAGLLKHAYVHHVCVVSAKTGYGIEQLVTRLMKDWAREGKRSTLLFLRGLEKVTSK